MEKNYKETRKEIQEAIREFNCKGDVIVRTAIQNVIDYGRTTIDKNYLGLWINAINKRHDKADENGDVLFVSRDFEIAVAKCTYKLAQFKAIDLIKYLQRDLWFYDNWREIDYERAMDLARYGVDIAFGFGSCDRETDLVYEDLMIAGYKDDELIELGYEEIFFPEENEE